MRVGIIGGGAAGLAAAYEFLCFGHEVTVFERAPFLGGQASTFEVGGTRLERGYHHLFTTDTDMIWLIHELGLGNLLAWIPSRAGLFHGGRIWDFTTPMDLIRFHGISLFDRLRLGLMGLYLQRVKDWRRFEGVTAADWLAKWAGRRAYQTVWEPLLRGKFGQRFDQVSMVWFWGKIALRFASRTKGMIREVLGYPMCSFGEIFDSLGRRIESMGGQVMTGAIVRKVIISEENRVVGLEVQLPGHEATVFPFDVVVSTVPSQIFPRLVPDLPQTYLEKLTGVEYLAAVLVILELDRQLTPMYWLNIADRDIPFVGVIEQTNFLTPDHYGGRHVVYLANYLEKEDPLYHMDHQQLLDVYRPHLQKLNPDFEDSWVLDTHYHREDSAQPVIRINYTDQIPSHRTPVRGLYLANTTQIYPEDRGTNYSVRIGRKVVHGILKDLGISVNSELPAPAIKGSITSSANWG